MTTLNLKEDCDDDEDESLNLDKIQAETIFAPFTGQSQPVQKTSIPIEVKVEAPVPAPKKQANLY